MGSGLGLGVRVRCIARKFLLLFVTILSSELPKHEM